MATSDRPVLVTGGGSFLGDHIAAALLAEGVAVTLLIRSGREDRLGPLAHHTRCEVADVWDPASLRGRARGHQAVIHTVGSMSEDRTQGLTYERLNLVSARNAANMCVSDGVPHMVLLSAAGSPWLNRRYVRAKRQAEVYLGRVGLQATVIRAPLVYVRGSARPLLYQLLTLAGQLPLLSWTVLGRVGPLPVDVLARGVARITLAADKTKTIYHARDIRKLVKRHELRQFIPLLAGILAPANAYRPEHPSDATVPNRSRLDSDNRERLS